MKRLLLLALLLPLTVFAQSSQVNLAALASKLVTPGIVPLTAGGTGVTTAAAAINQLLPSQTGQSGTCLGTNGSAPSWIACGGSGNVSTSGSPAQYQLSVFTSGTSITGIAPSSTAGEALGSNGSASNPSFMTSLAGVTSVNSTSIPNGQTLVYAGGPLGTPSSGVLTNATGLPISTGVSGLGTGVATALAVNVGSAGAAVVNGGALGTPSSGVATNLTGTASALNIGGTAANLSGTPALPNGTTATTQTTGDNTSKVATDAFVIANAGAGSGTVTDGSGTTTAGQFLLSSTTAHTYAVSTPAQAIGALTSGTPNAQTGTTYTTVIGDANGEVTMANASANTLTIPTNASVAYNIGTVITVQQLSTGLTTVSPASGVTIQSAAFGSSATQGYPLGGDFGLIQLQKAATNTWNVIAYEPGQGSVTLSGTCTHSANTGDGYGGTYTMSSAGNCTIIATPTGVLPAQVLWTGVMTDATQPTIPGWGPTSESATAVTFTVPTAVASSDVLVYTLTRH